MSITRQHLRSWLSAGLHYSGTNSVALALRTRHDCVTVLCYHRVLDVDSLAYQRSEPSMVTSTEAFEKEMELIAEQFNAISLSDMVRWMDGEVSLPSRSILVTFDDGWSDTYTNAFPIMRRLSIPGAVFLSTGYIGTSMKYWTDRVYDLLEPSLGADGAIKEMHRMKSLPVRQRAAIVHTMERAFGAGRVRAPGENLTWEAVREMAASGFEFGSHTRNHVILPNEVGTQILKELSSSADDIQFHLEYVPLGLAYPDGQFDESATRLAAAAHYKCAFTCCEGLCNRRTPRHALPRLLIHDGVVTRPDGAFSSAMFLTLISGTIPWRHRRLAS